jgi:hypothetical protein
LVELKGSDGIHGPEFWSPASGFGDAGALSEFIGGSDIPGGKCMLRGGFCARAGVGELQIISAASRLKNVAKNCPRLWIVDFIVSAFWF